MVDDNADRKGLLPVDPSSLELGESETTALPDLGVVADSLGTDSWAEEGERPDTEGSSLSLAGVATTELASWLIEPCPDPALPVFAEMVRGEDVVVSETHICDIQQSQRQSIENLELKCV